MQKIKSNLDDKQDEIAHTGLDLEDHIINKRKEIEKYIHKKNEVDMVDEDTRKKLLAFQEFNI